MDNNSYKDMADHKISSFDSISSNDHIRMLKIFLHYIPVAFRKNLSIYIKYMELQHILNHPLSVRKDKSSDADDSGNIPNGFFNEHFAALINELLPYCSPQERKKFEGIQNMISSFEQIKNMMEMFEMMKDMKDMFGDGEGGFNPEMLASMMGMDGFDFSNFSK